MKKIRVLYYADSLGMARPGLLTFSQRYIEELRGYWTSKGFSVELFDRSRGGLTLDNLFGWYKQDINYIGDPIDVLIIQAGVVDCAPRPMPNRVRNWISKTPLFIRNRIINFLHNNRAKLFRNGLKFYYTNQKEFFNVVKKWLNNAEKISNRVYIFTIAPTNENTEKHSPGFSESIQLYNNLIIKAATESSNKNVFIIDIPRLIKESADNIDEIVSPIDGHHITLKGNQLYAKAIIQNEERLL